MNSFLNNNKFVFWLVFVVYISISIFLVGNHDYSSDSSLYAVRAFGWTDYMGNGQKGPVQWLGHGTWWSSLSFQDAPPVVFALENMFYRIFGGETSSLHILFLLSGVIIFCAIYFCVKKIKDTETALWASTAFAVSSYALWSSISGNLEGVQSLFIVLHFLTMVLFIKYRNNKYLYSAVTFMALALMSKYTSIFIIPSFIISMYIGNKYSENTSETSGKKVTKYIFSALLFLLIISPTFIYNFHLYKLRGNFDTALSAMVGMENELNRGINFDFVGSLFQIFSVLFQTSSFPYILVCLVGFLFIAVKSQNKKADYFEESVVVYISMLFIMFGFMGGGVRWLPLSIPFLAIAFSLIVVEIKKNYKSIGVFVLAIIILIFEFGYSINTNLLLNPIGRVGVFSSSTRNSSYGFNELEKYLNKELSPFSEIYRVTKAEEFEILDPRLNDLSDKVIVYDGRINWFATWWYLERYRIYYRINVFSFDNSKIRNMVFPRNRIENSSLNGSGKTLYFIRALDGRVMNAETSGSLSDRLEAFAEHLETKKISFVDIANRYGEVAFRVYKIEFK